jgi:hypothetical protein
MNSEKKLCPSHNCQEGSILLGVVDGNGRVDFLTDRMIVNQEFVQIARAGRTPEKRFRFGGQCVTSGCKQWTGKRCGVIDSITESVEINVENADLPECSIRSECRWFYQSGSEACAICPEVITDLREEIA